MRRKNVKGFSLVELLAVIAILGILSGLGIIAYNRYTQRARKDSYKELAESSINGAKQYFMDHPRETSVSLEKLLAGQYVNNINDPSNNPCNGEVVKISDATPSPTPETSSLQSTELIVNISCTNYNCEYATKKDLISEENRCGK